jgi:hypothetical protein
MGAFGTEGIGKYISEKTGMKGRIFSVVFYALSQKKKYS